MKIRIHTPSGYIGLAGLEFPMVVEAYQILDKAAHVKASIMQAYGCRETCDLDYVFLEDEFTIVEEGKSLCDLYGDGARVDLEEAADLAAKDLAEKVFGADRKALLLRLVMDYGDAINNTCYTSQRGSAESLKACIAKEERLLKEITKMIEEGV